VVQKNKGKNHFIEEGTALWTNSGRSKKEEEKMKEGI